MNYVNAVSAHPEPQFARENFVSLDGEWRVALNGGSPRTVRVPYCIESELSGIGEKALITDLVYTRTFRLPEAMRGGRVFLHFGAVDHTAEVFVNGSPAGRHSGVVIITSLPPCSRNVRLAMIFGNMLPGGKCPSCI